MKQLLSSVPLLLSLLLLSAVIVVHGQIARQNCSFALSYTTNVTDINGMITATFTVAPNQAVSIIHVQFHIAKNCAAEMSTDPVYDGPVPIVIPFASSNQGQCAFPWFQPPFDVMSPWVAQNQIAFSNNNGNSPGSSYNPNTLTYTFHFPDTSLQLQPGDILCYDFTYDSSTVSCNTGICNVGPPPTEPVIIGVKGDPQFTGFQGQEFQVHGVSGDVYNLFSTSHLQVNGEFVFLNSGHCDKSMNTLCYSHPGSYIGKIGIVYRSSHPHHHHTHINETRLLIQSGKWNVGMRVYLNDRLITLPDSDSSSSSSSNASHPANGYLYKAQGIIVRYSQKHKIHIHTSELALTIVNSDKFLNLDMDLADEFLDDSSIHSCEWPAAEAEYDEPHGLMGQTWCLRKMESDKVEGEIDQYVVADGMFGTSFEFNKF